MKKWLLCMMGLVLVASLSQGTFSKPAVHAGCNPLPHATPYSGVDAAACTSAADSREIAALATAEVEAAQQNDQQDNSFSGRILHVVDMFARLVMVI
jgi:hypothetical protein